MQTRLAIGLLAIPDHRYNSAYKLANALKMLEVSNARIAARLA